MKNKMIVINDEAINNVQSNLANISTSFDEIIDGLKNCDIIEELGLDNGAIDEMQNDTQKCQDSINNLNDVLNKFKNKANEMDDYLASNLIKLREYDSNNN